MKRPVPLYGFTAFGQAIKAARTREITIVYNFIGAFDFTWAIEEAHNTTQKQQKTA